ncbi:uncharacterized protein DUF397 [Micromonospora sp. Llam0]|uniref:DUF397 domain-containing protein n=1 Tax=Micromonospora sp. Llam0 TaxID=2485143 RepID=UPI000F48D13B|nr:DUF397 domain-containing protein [Micromonospora sp. Llam0]ROO63059.1 uncharacterized protein DUF397 [Micromonospora sp. Llam0]
MTTPKHIWRKSSRSDDGNCVEVAHTIDTVLIRDSKNPDGPMLRFGPQQWHSFARGFLASGLNSPNAPE